MFLFIEYSRLYFSQNTFMKETSTAVPEGVTLCLQEELFPGQWEPLVGLLACFHFGTEQEGANKKTCSKSHYKSKFTVLDQEPEATCSGNSICAFLQANNQVFASVFANNYLVLLSARWVGLQLSLYLPYLCICQQPDQCLSLPTTKTMPWWMFRSESAILDYLK